MRTKIYVAYGKQSRLNQLKDYIEVKINRLNYKIQKFCENCTKKMERKYIYGIINRKRINESCRI